MLNCLYVKDVFSISSVIHKLIAKIWLRYFLRSKWKHGWIMLLQRHKRRINSNAYLLYTYRLDILVRWLIFLPPVTFIQPPISHKDLGSWALPHPFQFNLDAYTQIHDGPTTQVVYFSDNLVTYLLRYS